MKTEIAEEINERLKRLEEKFETKNEIEVIEAKKPIKDFVKGLDIIVLLGRGQSLRRCPEAKPEGAKIEIWGCNNVYRARKVDRLFLIKDPYTVQYEREPNLINEINEHDFPVYTLGAFPELKNNVPYPIKEVIEEYAKTGEGATYMMNTVAKMLALAILQQPKKIILFGCDMEYGTNNEYLRNEKACLESWLGMAKGRGIDYELPAESTLLKRKGLTNTYGYEQIEDQGSYGIKRIQPKYSFGDPQGKCPIRYKLIKRNNVI